MVAFGIAGVNDGFCADFFDVRSSKAAAKNDPTWKGTFVDLRSIQKPLKEKYRSDPVRLASR
jgi:hypothetical protein